MEKEDLFARHMQDLARTADQRGCIVFSDFLTLDEQNIYEQTIQKFPRIRGETFGGYEGSERRIAAFIPSEFAPELFSENSAPLSPSGIAYPICCVRIFPRAPKFAEKLNHRDILGALMHLGIERSTMGDIAVDETESYLFCTFRVEDLILRELTRIRHTEVLCEAVDLQNFTYVPATEKVRGTVASVRLDALLSLAFGASRTSLLSLIEKGSVSVNGRVVTTNSYVPKEGDIISVRGRGRFRYLGSRGNTRKGRLVAEIARYI